MSRTLPKKLDVPYLEDAMMTEGEVADFLVIKAETLRQWRYHDKGPPYYKIEGAIRYRLPELQQYLYECRVCPRYDVKEEEKEHGND